TASHGRAPSPDEIIRGLDWTRKIFATSFPPHETSVESTITEDAAGATMAIRDLLVACDSGPDGHELTESFFQDICRGLPFDVQVMVYLYFVRDATMKSIGQVFSLSESRVSQQMT